MINAGCRFAPRCPYVMAECTAEMPPLYRVGDTQAALCYLHRDASLGNVKSISDVFKSSI